MLVAGFAIRQGDRVFAKLAENMDANPALDVRIFTNIPRHMKERRSDSELVRIFADDFRNDQWPGTRFPKVLYDPRALSTDRGPRSCLHAKCVIVDDQRTLITSANTPFRPAFSTAAASIFGEPFDKMTIFCRVGQRPGC